MSLFTPYDHMKVEHYNGGTWNDFTADLTGFRLVLREFTGRHSGSLSFYNDTMNPALTNDLDTGFGEGPFGEGPFGEGSSVVKKGDKVRIFMDNPSGDSRKVATMKITKVSTSNQDFTRPVGRQSQVTIDLIGTGIGGVGGAA